MDFAVGDTVRIIPDAKWHEPGSKEYFEKVGVIGRIVKCHNTMPIIHYEDGMTLLVLRHEIEKVEDLFADTGSF